MHVTALTVVLVVATLPTIQALTCAAPFKAVANKWCVVVNISVPDVAHKWLGARSACQEIKGDLIILDTQEKMQAITNHLNAELSGESLTYPLWVGGRGYSGVWWWVDGRPMNLLLHLWHPEEPSKKDGLQSAMLIKRSETRYMVSGTNEQTNPGYICET
nr:C-type lectin domain family 4 member A [Charybdis japonica]